MDGRKGRSFTLLELLVVVGILATLAAFLLPAIQGASKKAKRTFCASHLRQVGTLITLYTSENDGFMMPADMGGRIDSWINYMAAHYSDEDPGIYQCPSIPKGQQFDPYGGEPPRYDRVSAASYVLNTISDDGWDTASIPPADAEATGWGNGTNHPIRFSDAERPGNAIMVTDAVAGISSTDARGIVRFDETDHGVIEGGDRDVGLCHAMAFNSLFGDGHVSHLSSTKPEQWMTVLDENAGN